ncbi:class I adenylate-forming enzyme family protein [Sphingopyxis sp.]|uniref:class I adenylate-forming enzyme family protein n=1 Tax=Sphingopyxis sp. TaxID=1908224 RepID=UPI003BAC0F50
MSAALLYDGLDYWARHAPDRLAVILDGEESLTYEELARWSDGVADLLQRSGVAAGDRVVITGINMLEWPPALAGILKAGAVPVPLNERFVAAEFSDLIDRIAPAAIIADAPRAALLAEAVPDVPRIAMEELAQVRGGARPGWSAVRVDARALSLIVFTSGTTGRPKGVTFTHERQMAKFAEFRLIEATMVAGMNVLMPFAMQSGPGSLWAFPLTTIYGGTMHFVRKFDAQRLLEIIVRHRVSYVNGMPVLYEQIARLPEFETVDLSFLTMAQVGGARVSKELTARWRERGVALRQLYGMTEAGGLAIVASEADAIASPDACGRGGMFTRVRIVDEEGRDCPRGVQGDVRISGPGFTAGYWMDPEGTKQLFDTDGAMITGDIGMIDEEGHFFFIDRSKDLIISGGFNIAPSEIEHVITAIDGVAEVAVFAVPDAKFGEAPAACIHSIDPLDAEAIREHCRQRLAGFKQPRHIFFHDGPLPRMASNKIAKRDLAARYTAILDTQAAAEPVATAASA